MAVLWVPQNFSNAEIFLLVQFNYINVARAPFLRRAGLAR